MFDNEDLVFVSANDKGEIEYKDKNDLVIFSKDDIDNLIKALHLSCKHGYGRTSLWNLFDFYEDVKKRVKFKNLKLK